MFSKPFLNPGHTLLPLGLIALTSFPIAAPARSQTFDGGLGNGFGNGCNGWMVEGGEGISHYISPSLENKFSVNTSVFPRPPRTSLAPSAYLCISQPKELTQLPTIPDIPPQRPTTPLPEPQPPSPPPSEELLQSPLPVPETPEPIPGQVPATITVSRFEFEGNTVISDEELAAATAEFTNRPLPFAEVFEVRSKITQLYRERGYISSGAIIPAQTFRSADGVVKIQVIEGGLETINVTGTRRLNPDYIRDRISLRAGTPLNRDTLLEALQLLQLDPLIANLSAELAAGTRPGSSVLTVQVEEAKTWRGEFTLNNNRSPSIGTLEAQATVTQANLTGEGDGLSVSYGHTQGSDTLEGSYTYPLNARNDTLRLRINYSFSDVVEEPFDRINIEADSQYYELTWRKPLLQNLNREFAIGVTASNQESDVTVFDVPVRLSPGADEEGRTRVSALRFFQEWTQRNNREVFAARSQFNLGLGILGATTNDDAPDSRFLSWRGQVQWVRLLAPDSLLILRGDLQLSADELLRLEQFGVGGQDTVRGYRQNVFLSDNGAFASAEARFPIARWPGSDGLLQLAPFIDVGGVWNSSGNPDPEPDPNILVSVGLGLRLRLGDRFSARFDWGIPLVDVISSDRTWQEEGLYFSVFYRVF